MKSYIEGIKMPVEDCITPTKVTDDNYESIRALELAIMLQLDSEEQFKEIKQTETKYIQEMYDKKKDSTDFFDYNLIDIQFRSKDDIGGSVNLGLFVGPEGYSEAMSFEEYVSQSINYQVIVENNGHIVAEHYFDLTLTNLLEALKQYNKCITEFSFEN